MDSNGIGEPCGLEEGGGFADAASGTLCRLNTVMRQMRNWREDRDNLKRNVHRLRSALRAITAETWRTLPVDPLIERQRERIGQLELANETLRRELQEVRSSFLDSSGTVSGMVLVGKNRLEIEHSGLDSSVGSLGFLKEEDVGKGTEEDLRRKLREFVAGDQTIEVIFGDLVSKVVETVANLSEELVNVSERMQRARTKNYRLCNEIDRLRAILRSNGGTSTDYQKRVAELNQLANRLRREMAKLGLVSRRSKEADVYSYGLENLERLVNHLRNKLSNENDSLLAAGDPDCLTYVKRVIDLRVSLKLFSSRLANPGETREGNVGQNNYSSTIAGLQESLEQIDGEIGRMREDRVRKYCRMSDIDGSRYAEGLEELGAILEESRTTINSLKGGPTVEKKRAIEKRLEGLIDRLCREIKKVEVIVLSGDRTGQLRRIEELEGSIEQLRISMAGETDRGNNLRLECSNTAERLEQKIKELKDTQSRLAAVTEENETFRSRTKSLEERVLGLLHERDGSREGIKEAQQVKREADAIKRKLENLQSEKKTLLSRLARMRDLLIERNERIGQLLIEKQAAEKTHDQEVARLREKLRAKRQEMAEHRTEPDLDTLQNERMKEAERSLSEAGRAITDLKARLSRVSGDKARLEKTVIELESGREFLLHQLATERTTGEERLAELNGLRSAYNESESQTAELMGQRDRLTMELTQSRAESEALEKSIGEIRNKYKVLEELVEVYRSEINKFRADSEEANAALERTRAELSTREEETGRLVSENSRLGEDLASVGSRCTELEERVRVLLTERDEQGARINELTDRLDRARNENECISVELNKWRIESGSQLEASERSRSELERANRELGSSLNKIQSEYRVLDNQVKILREARGKPRCSSVSPEGVKNRFNKSEPSGGVEEVQRKTDGIVSNAIPSERNNVVASGGRKVADTKIGEKPGRPFGIGFETKRQRNGERLRLENAALRYELQNLRGKHCRVKLELTRTKGQFEKLWIELTKIHGGEPQWPRRRCAGIVNLYYRQEVNRYPGVQCNEYNKNALVDNADGSTGTVDRVRELSVEVHGRGQQTGRTEQPLNISGLLGLIENLKVENVSLRIELNTLRSILLVSVVKRGREERGRGELLEEMRALKLELTRLREEKESLSERLEACRGDLDNLRSERTALRAELTGLRLENSRIRHREGLLRDDYEKLQRILRTEPDRDCVGLLLKRVSEIAN